MSAPLDDPRIDEILEVIVALARLDFGRRAPVSDKLDAIDAIATGLNLLTDELQETAASKRELEAAYEALRAAQARLVHSGKLAAVGQLASSVAHEVNNPAAFVMANLTVMARELAKIRGAIDGLRDQAGEARQAALESLLGAGQEALDELATMVQENLDGMRRIVSIVRDLRTFSYADRDEIDLVDLNDMVTSTLQIVDAEIRHRARLVTDLQPLPPIPGHPGRLSQVILNLLLNAAHAIPEGAAEQNEIRVTTRHAGEAIVLCVEDTGGGIPEAVRGRIFEPFFTTKPRQTGTGLGLSLSAEIVQAHRGTINFQTEVGRGTRFEVRIPLDTGLVRVPPVPPPPAPLDPESPLRILLVDDEVHILAAYRRMLSPPHDVVVAAGGAAALAQLERDAAFDAIVCDLMMPDVDGPVLYETLRVRYPALMARLLFTTGGAFTARTSDFLAAVTNPVLQKPLDRATLTEALSRLRAK